MDVRCHPAPARRNILPLDSGVFGPDQLFQADPLLACDAQRIKDLMPLSRGENSTQGQLWKSRVERASQVREKDCCWAPRSRRLREVRSQACGGNQVPPRGTASFWRAPASAARGPTSWERTNLPTTLPATSRTELPGYSAR